MNIVLISDSLASGGAERVMSIMANYWADQGRHVTLITLDSEGNDFYPLDGRVSRVGLGCIKNSTSLWSAIRNNAARVRLLRAAIRGAKPDVVVSFQDIMNVMVLLAAWPLSVPVVVSERNDPGQHVIGPVWNRLRRWLYPRAAAVVVQTDPVKAWVTRFVSAERVHVIPNPVRPVTERTNIIPSLEVPRPYVAAMGRLERQKGFDLLLRAFAACQQEGWFLVIVGEGSERANLESLADKLGIGSRLYLTGRIKEPESVLQQAALFVLSSRYEGFPNALLEAMSYGVPVVSFNCPSGPDVIVRENIDGVLVPPLDVEAMAVEIKQLMNNEGRRRAYGEAAKEVRSRFSIEGVMGMWSGLLREMH